MNEYLIAYLIYRMASPVLLIIGLISAIRIGVKGLGLFSFLGVCLGLLGATLWILLS